MFDFLGDVGWLSRTTSSAKSFLFVGLIGDTNVSSNLGFFCSRGFLTGVEAAAGEGPPACLLPLCLLGVAKNTFGRNKMMIHSDHPADKDQDIITNLL